MKPNKLIRGKGGTAQVKTEKGRAINTKRAELKLSTNKKGTTFVKINKTYKEQNTTRPSMNTENGK